MWQEGIDASLTGSANADMTVWEFMTNYMLQIFLKLLQIAKKKKVFKMCNYTWCIFRLKTIYSIHIVILI